MFIHFEEELGVVQAQGTIVCAPGLEVPGNAIQCQYILHNLYGTAQSDEGEKAGLERSCALWAGRCALAVGMLMQP